MALPANDWMNRARSLTGSGKLAEATAVIQRALARIALPIAPAGPPSPAARPRSPVTKVVAKIARTILPDSLGADAKRSPLAGRASGFVAGKHAAYGLERAYKVYAPSQLAQSPALVVMLHGCTQSPDDFAIGTRMNEWAERQGFVVLYPAQSRSANPNACWNWYQTADQRADGGEVGLLASMTRKIVEEFAVDPTRVYAAGLSAGGAMAANLAAACPDLFAAIAVHSGLAAGAAGNVVDALGAMREGARAARLQANRGQGTDAVPTIVFHGDRDATVHPDNGEQVVAEALGGGVAAGAHEVDERVSAAGSTSERRSYRGADGTVRVEHWVLHGGRHAWAGGDVRGTHTDPKGIDATAEMLRFFASHRLPTTSSRGSVD